MASCTVHLDGAPIRSCIGMGNSFAPVSGSRASSPSTERLAATQRTPGPGHSGLANVPANRCSRPL
jgi:hypothetical protein